MGEMISDTLTRMREMFRRMAEVSETPEFQAALERLEAERNGEAEKERNRRRVRMGIPVGFFPALDAPHDTEARAAVREFRERGALFCLLLGEAGLGKSIALAEDVDKHGGLFVEATKLAREGYFDDDVSEGLKHADTLALDEAGMEAADQGGWYASKFYDVLNHRFQNGKPTLIASNLTPTEFKTRYGSAQLARLWDRMASSMVAKTLRGTSLRRKP
jgi:DNA replication protein DnaC